MPNGWIKDLLVTYNPVYQVTKFASKAVVKIAKFATGIVFGVSNRECNKERMDAIYKSGCYACDVVTALIGSFMNACTYLYDVAKEAGQQDPVGRRHALGCLLCPAAAVFAQKPRAVGNGQRTVDYGL